MKVLQFYTQNKDQWWALPLFLPVLLLPLLSLTDTYTQIDGGRVVLYYMPLAFLLTMMLFYGVAALPGIVLALFFRYFPQAGWYEASAITAHFIIPLVLSWGGYRVFAPRRSMTSYGDMRLMAQRLFWQVFCPSTIFLILFQFAAWLGLYESRMSMAGVNPMSIRTLISYQGLLVGCLTGVPFCYMIIRIIRHPRYIKRIILQIRTQMDASVKPMEFVLWVAVTISLLGLLLSPPGVNSSIFSTNYTLSLLMPVMLWGSMRFGYRFMSIVWTPVLIISIHFFQNYLPFYQGYDIQLTITSSSYLVFSFIIIYMAMLSTRQRAINIRSHRLAFLDPVLHMPNLRALSRSLAKQPWSVLCFLRIPELEIYGRNYGILLRIQYKQQLAGWINGYLQQDENVFQLSGYDLAIRMNAESHQSRLEELDEHIKRFRFVWDGMPLQPQVGISYCYVRSPVTHLHLLLGELSIIVDLSLLTNHPESLQQRGATNLQRGLKDKMMMMTRIQSALEQNTFRLMTRPVSGTRGDYYHEVLLELPDESGGTISFAQFLPVAQEFGLSSRIDLWVLENMLRFMDENRASLPGHRFAISLSPTSVCRAQFPLEVGRLLKKYSIEAWQLIFEINESSTLANVEQVNQIISQLQQKGSRIAIDGFGTGYASYARLKSVDADILKIDGSFIRNVTGSSLDYQIVDSICHLARMKKMLVVAQDIESEEIRSAVSTLGIDYLQGDAIGKPEPLERLTGIQAP